MRAAPPPPPNEPDILALIDEAELAVNTDTSITIDDSFDPTTSSSPSPSITIDDSFDPLRSDQTSTTSSSPSPSITIDDSFDPLRSDQTSTTSSSPSPSPPPSPPPSPQPMLNTMVDYEHITRDLLKYVVRSSEHDMLSAEYDDKLKLAARNVVVMICIISAFFGLIEQWSFGDSLWFSFVTMTTIGFGDFTPTTSFGRGCFVVLSIVGLGQLTLLIAEIVDYSQRQRELDKSAVRRIQAAEIHKGHQSHTRKLKRMGPCGIFPAPKSHLQKSGITAFISLASFWFLMGSCGLILKWSEGWIISDGIYFAFQTSTTIGYGDQGSLYRYWELTATNLGDIEKSMKWSEVVLGNETNSTLGTVSFDECLKSKGKCTIDATSCSCTFSDISKLILGIYFLASASSLGVLFDSVLQYSQELEHEFERSLIEKSKKMKRLISKAPKKRRKSSVNLPEMPRHGFGGSKTSQHKISPIKKKQTELDIVKARDALGIASSSDAVEKKTSKRRNGIDVTHSIIIDSSSTPTKTSCDTFWSSHHHFAHTLKLLSVVVLVVLFLVIGGLIFTLIEPDNFTDLGIGIYFCAISLTTIGYGDYSATTTSGRIFLIFYCIIGVAFITKVLTGLEKSMQLLTNARVVCFKKNKCLKKYISNWSDQAVVLIIVLVQSFTLYVVGLSLFLLFEVTIGQNGNVFVNQDQDNGSWYEMNILLFFNAVTTTTIGYGANYYPRTQSGRDYLVVFAWFSLSNTFFLIDAINDFVQERSQTRWKARQKDLMLTSGLSELEGLLSLAEKKLPEHFIELDERFHKRHHLEMKHFSTDELFGEFDNV